MIAYFGSDTPSREVRKEPLKGDMIKTNGLKHREQSRVVNTVESFGCIQQYAMNMVPFCPKTHATLPGW